MFPIADDTEAFELSCLHFGKFFGVIGTFVAQLYRSYLVPVYPLLFKNLQLCRESVSIKTRDIRSKKSAQPFILYNKIFQTTDT